MYFNPNLEDSDTNNYQNHVGCSFGYRLVCVDDQISKPFKSYLGEDTVHKLITNIVEEVSIAVA